MTKKATHNSFFPDNKPGPLQDVTKDMLRRGLAAERDGGSLTPDFIGGVDPDLLPDDEGRRAEGGIES